MNEDVDNLKGSILPPSLKSVVEMFVVKGRSIRDISRSLEIPEAVVRTRLFYARVFLRSGRVRPP